jgi:hypothetical protein
MWTRRASTLIELSECEGGFRGQQVHGVILASAIPRKRGHWVQGVLGAHIMRDLVRLLAYGISNASNMDSFSIILFAIASCKRARYTGPRANANLMLYYARIMLLTWCRNGRQSLQDLGRCSYLLVSEKFRDGQDNFTSSRPSPGQQRQ